MVCRVWNLKRVLAVVFLVPFTIFTIAWDMSTLDILIYGEGGWRTFITCLVIMVGGLAVLLYLFAILLIPRYYRCMKVIRRYLRYRDLKTLLREQEFRMIDLSGYIGKRSKNLIYCSEKWLCVDKIYIPRKLIYDVVFQVFPDRPYEWIDVFVATNSGLLIFIGKYPMEAVKGIEKVLKDNIPEVKSDPHSGYLIFGTNKQSDMKKDFKDKVTDRQQFLYAAGLELPVEPE